MGMASGTTDPHHDTAIDFSFLDNVPVKEQPDVKTKRRKRANARQKTPEHLYAALIKAGQVRIVRRKGKAPLIEWL